MAIIIPYVKQTWTDGSGGGTPDSAARLGVIEEGILDVSQAPAVRVTHSANQSATNAVALTLAFDTEAFDQAGGAASTMHDTVTNNSRLTCRYAGVYAINGQVEFAANATGQRTVAVVINAGNRIFANTWDAAAAGTTQMTVVGHYLLAVNDFVELIVVQTSGGALNVLTTTNVVGPAFSMIRVA